MFDNFVVYNALVPVIPLSAQVRRQRQLPGPHVLCGRKWNPTDWWLPAHRATVCENGAPSPPCICAGIDKRAWVRVKITLTRNKLHATRTSVRGEQTEAAQAISCQPVEWMGNGMHVHTGVHQNKTNDSAAPPRHSADEQKVNHWNNWVTDEPGQQVQHPRRCSARRHQPPIPCPRGSPGHRRTRTSPVHTLTPAQCFDVIFMHASSYQ